MPETREIKCAACNAVVYTARPKGPAACPSCGTPYEAEPAEPRRRGRK